MKKRVTIYLSGIFFVSLGIVLCVKCGLGISPISSVPYVLSVILPLSFGTLTILFHLVNTVFQYIAERKFLNAKVILQIPIAVLFGIVIDWLKRIMTFRVNNIRLQSLLMLFSVFFTALGMHFMLSAKLIQNPPDGTVNLLADKRKTETGSVKIVYDVMMVAISVIISLLAAHKIIGFGVATIFSAFFVGKILSILRKIIKIEMT